MNSLRAIGWPWPDAPDDPQWRELLAAHPQAHPARVVEQHRSGYRVATGPDPDAVATAVSPPQWQRPRFPPEQRAAVGDWVLVQRQGGSEQIVALLPRLRAIERAAAGEHYRRQVIAANIDTVFVVCGLDADFNPRRIERYLLLIEGSGAAPVVLLTKADHADADASAAQAALGDIRAQRIPVLALNAKDPHVREMLAPWLQPGSTAVLVGSSGAGKSTLTNTLLGDARMKTGQVRASDERGRHTTTHRALIALPGGACLIDTPGMRELKPTGEENVERNFAEIDALAEQCRFRDCQHEREPGCAVRQALDDGTLDAQRYASYRKLRDEVSHAATRREAQATGKPPVRAQTRALSRRFDEKPGRH